MARRIDKLVFSPAGYLSPTSDPFQPVNEKYKLSEKIIKVFVERNLPLVIATKGRVSEEAIKLLAEQKDSVLEFSLLTLSERLRKFLSPRGASVRETLSFIEKASRFGIHTVLRLDPILPGVNDRLEDIYNLIREARERGIRHVIASCLDIPVPIKRHVLKALSSLDSSLPPRYEDLYVERIRNSLHAKTEYRKKIFSEVRDVADSLRVTLSLCMEFDINGFDLNEIYATSRSCEGKGIPIYFRKGGVFKPLPCSNEGACLTCSDPVCGLEELAMRGKPRYFSYSDFRRFSDIGRVGSIFRPRDSMVKC